jgi:hypothetical protein
MQNYELFFNMQNICRKFYYFFFIFLFFPASEAVFAQSIEKLAQADKYFSERKYEKARELYEEIRHKEKKISEQSLVKLAFIAEKIEKDEAKALFYLSLFYELTKNKQAQSYLVGLAQKNNLPGYSFGDAAFFAEIYTSFRVYFLSALIFGMGGLCFWLFDRIKKRKFNRTNYYISATAFFSILLLFFLNIDIRKPYAIVVHENSLLYTAPAAASNIVGLLPKGSRVTVGKSADIWQEVEWEDKQYFVRKTHLGYVLTK